MNSPRTTVLYSIRGAGYSGIQYRHLSLVGTEVHISTNDDRVYHGTLTAVHGTAQLTIREHDGSTCTIAGSVINSITPAVR